MKKTITQAIKIKSYLYKKGMFITFEIANMRNIATGKTHDNACCTAK